MGKNLSAVPVVLTLKDTLATVEGGVPSAPKEPEDGLLSNVEVIAKFVAPDAVQAPAVISNDAPMVASALKEPEDGLLSKVVSAPSSVAIGKGNVKLPSSSDDDSSDSGSEESDSGNDSSNSSSTSSSGSHAGQPMTPSFPIGVGTAVVSTAELVDAVSAASVATAKLLGPELPSASLFKGSPEDTLPDTYGPGKSKEGNYETTGEGVMDVTNTIFEEESDDVDGSEEE